MSTTIDGSAGVTINSGAVLGITSGTALSYTQATNSGTTLDFTSIPSWVKRITVMFNGVSLSGTSDILVQLGISGSIVSTGYISSSFVQSTSPVSAISNSTAGFAVRLASATSVFYGIVVVASIATNQFVSSHSGRQTATSAIFGGGSVSLGGTLTTVRITTANSIDTFTAGSINILYE